MTIRESEFFNYDGIDSSSMGIYNISLSGGLFDEPFLFERNINEIKIRNRDKPYLQNVERTPLTFSLTFAFEDSWNDEKIRRVARWLDQDYYKPMYFSENPKRIFYCMTTGDSALIHNGLKQGYITLTMRCDSPYSYSPMTTTPKYTFLFNSNGSNITINNDGDKTIYPEVWIKKRQNAGNITVANMLTLEEFKFTNLAVNETVYIDNENQHIESDIPNMYRYNAFNNKYLKLYRGINTLTIYGDCEIQLRYQCKILQ